MKKTVIFITGIYDTLDLFTEQLRQSFYRLGCHTFTYHAASEDEGKEALQELLCTGAGDAVCVTFNNLGYNLEIVPENGERPVNIWEYYNVSYINILMDHPFHYKRPLAGAPSTSIVLCTDQNHVRYIRRFYKNIKKTEFLPHAGVELGHRHKPLAERRIDVLYAGALPVYTVGRMIPDLDSIPETDGNEMAKAVLEELVHHPYKTTEEVVEDYLRDRRDDISDKRLAEIIVKMRFLDSYATSFFREQAVRILVENGISVTAYGVGWDQCEWSGNPYLNYGGKVTAPEILPLMNDAKIVLNTNTWFKAGAHDRIFNGMLAKAAVVSDESDYLNRVCRDGEELALFSLEKITSLPERVFQLFGNLKEMQAMADRGYEYAQKNHTWMQRAEYIYGELICRS